MARKRDDTVKLVLRLPPQLHRRLTRIATRKNQSLNSEMVQRLERSFEWEVASELLARRGTPEYESEAVPIGSGPRTMSDVLAMIERMNNKLDRIIDKPEAEEAKDDGEKK